MLWTYPSSGGEVFSVKPGQIWSAGRHRIACGDLEDGDARLLLRTLNRVPDLVYTDPPWNAGNAASFRTKAASPRKVDFEGFLYRLIDTIRLVRRYAFIEMGEQNASLLEQVIRDSDGTILAHWPITYYHRHPCELFCATWTGQPAPNCDLTNQDDTSTPYLALTTVCDNSGEIVFDPCTGRGLTARTAHSMGLKFIGMELSPWRTSATLHSLQRLGLLVVVTGALQTQAA